MGKIIMSKELELDDLFDWQHKLKVIYIEVSSHREIEQLDYAADYISDALEFIEKQINLQKMFEMELEPDEDVD